MTKGNGKPCKKCGASEWYKGGNCKECARLRRQTPEHKAYYQTPEYRAYNKARKKTPEYRAYNKARKQAPEAKARKKACYGIGLRIRRWYQHRLNKPSA